MNHGRPSGVAASDDLVTWLSKVAAASRLPPKIVTLGRTPTKNLLGHVFGPSATASLILSPGEDFARPDGAFGSPWDFAPTALAVLARFTDPATFEFTARRHGDWLTAVVAVILQFPPTPSVVGALGRAGFTESRTFAGPGAVRTVFHGPVRSFAPRRDTRATAIRPPIGRLIIIDPCLGAAGGHYLPYAHLLTTGAQASGVDVVWGCHARFEGPAPPCVTVRRCFPRCFFDLGRGNVSAVDLSTELLEGWVQLLDAFDDPRTQFLMHSADAHQLRAVAKVLDARPTLRSTIHVNLQTSPRYMPGRIAGPETHATVSRLRTSGEWERSLFLWSETRRLGAWLSQWLGEDIPTLPFLPPSVAAPGQAVHESGHALTLSFLGEGRPAKGFLDLPDIVDKIAAAPPLRGAVKVVVQNWLNFSADRHDHDQAVARLRRQPIVEIIDGVLDAEDYQKRLAQADALLLPYDPETYALQGSGILIEGFTHGAVILARAGTMMEDEGHNGVVAVYRTPDELVEILIRLLNDQPAATLRARTLAARFRAINTPARYIAALAERARGVSHSTPPV